jgi:hypothetical protein
LETGFRQEARACDSVHAEHARFTLINVAREDVPNRWLNQQPMRFRAARGLVTLSIHVLKSKSEACGKGLLKQS